MHRGDAARLMILVDSSVWIDYLQDLDSPPRRFGSSSFVWSDQLAVGDRILTEVLQGCRSERAFGQRRAISCRTFTK